MGTRERIQKVIDNPGTSYWLKSLLQTALNRDPVDVEIDLNLAHELLSAHFDAVFSAVR